MKKQHVEETLKRYEAMSSQLESSENKLSSDAGGDEEFIARLNECADIAGSVNALAKQAGISQSGIRRYFSGGEPTRPVLIAIAKAVGVNFLWLSLGIGPKFPGDKEPIAGVIESDDYLYIPLYDVRASAGHGAWNDSENIKDSLAFRRQWIQQELGAKPDQLCLIYVEGESMEPALHAHDVVLVDRSVNELNGDGIYVLVMDGKLLIKRLQSLPGKKVSVSADNPAYKSFIISDDLDSPDLYLIGKVVWTGRKL
jgi:phage repressor protein C with HTH and peptisase S24 domain